MILQGKKITITGRLAFYTRNQAFALIRTLGGIPQNYVSYDTDYLVIGAICKFNRSKKIVTAEKYLKKGSKIQILSDEQFVKMLWD